MASQAGNLPMRLLRKKLHKRNLKIRQRNLARQAAQASPRGEGAPDLNKALETLPWEFGFFLLDFKSVSMQVTVSNLHIITENILEEVSSMVSQKQWWKNRRLRVWRRQTTPNAEEARCTQPKLKKKGKKK